jgi:parallel beta-helix repeat protein
MPRPSGATAASGVGLAEATAVPPAAVVDRDCVGPTLRVRDSAGLRQALAAAKPGDVIQLADGQYQGNFTGRANGAADRRITLCGSRHAVLTSGGGYSLHLDGASYWRLAGFTIRGGEKGLMIDRGQHNIIEGLLIEQTGHEGLHLRSASSDNLVRGNEIRQTGRGSPEFGEGIYVGSAQANWSRFGGGGPDRSDRNLIEGNTISDTTAECVDIKEGTSGGTLRANTFSGRGLSGGFADSWVDVKGNGWTIVDNVGSDSKVDGFQVHQIVPGWGIGNRFGNNRATLSGSGLAINITQNAALNQVSCDNQVIGGTALSNVPCGPSDGALAAPLAGPWHGP